MPDVVQRLLADVAPGDRLDLDLISLEYGEDVKIRFFEEFEGQGFVLNSDGVVGCVDTCAHCDGTGLNCGRCEGFSLTVDYGEGPKPYSD